MPPFNYYVWRLQKELIARIETDHRLLMIWKGAVLLLASTGGMPIAKAARNWLFPVPPHIETSPSSLPSTGHTDFSAPAGSSPPSLSGKKRSASSRRQLEAFETIFDDSWACCRLQCSAGFASQGDEGLHMKMLRAERERFASCSRSSDRKTFVSNRVPVCKLTRGGMIAAGRPVCIDFFSKMFGVSRNLIYACKGTPGARASSECNGR